MEEDTEELHIHHVNGDGETSKVGGGWQALYQYLEDFVNGTPLKIVCKSCHREIHDILEFDFNE